MKATAIFETIQFGRNPVLDLDTSVMHGATLFPIIQELAGYAEEIKVGDHVFHITTVAARELLTKVQTGTACNSWKFLAGSKDIGMHTFNCTVLESTAWKYEAVDQSWDLVPKVAGAQPTKERLSSVALFAQAWQKWCFPTQ